jgi:hypothetical protein
MRIEKKINEKILDLVDYIACTNRMNNASIINNNITLASGIQMMRDVTPKPSQLKYDEHPHSNNMS